MRNIQALAARIETAGQNPAILGALYAEIVGYDPFEDDPEISVLEVRETLFDFVLDLQ